MVEVLRFFHWNQFSVLVMNMARHMWSCSFWPWTVGQSGYIRAQEQCDMGKHQCSWFRTHSDRPWCWCSGTLKSLSFQSVKHCKALVLPSEGSVFSCQQEVSYIAWHCFPYLVCTVQGMWCFHALTGVGQTHCGQHLSPCGFRLFGILRKMLKGYRFWLGKINKALVVQWSCGFSRLLRLGILTKFVFNNFVSTFLSESCQSVM